MQLCATVLIHSVPVIPAVLSLAHLLTSLTAL
jgi:hypothetical protein